MEACLAFYVLSTVKIVTWLDLNIGIDWTWIRKGVM